MDTGNSTAQVAPLSIVSFPVSNNNGTVADDTDDYLEEPLGRNETIVMTRYKPGEMTSSAPTRKKIKRRIRINPETGQRQVMKRRKVPKTVVEETEM